MIYVVLSYPPLLPNLKKKLEEITIELHKEMFNIAIRAIVFSILGGDFDSEDEVQKIQDAYTKCWSEIEARLVVRSDEDGVCVTV